MNYCVFEIAWGSFGFVARNDRLIATWLPQAGDRLRRRIESSYPDAVEDACALPEFQRQVVGYFEGEVTEFTVRLDTGDMPLFRRAVLAVCEAIPYGETVTYADLAKAVGNPAAARAAGGAMAFNPLPLVIPCHRVLRSDGSLGGFSSTGGLTLKERMLQLEKAGVRRSAGTSAQRTRRKGRSRIAAAAPC